MRGWYYIYNSIVPPFIIDLFEMDAEGNNLNIKQLPDAATGTLVRHRLCDWSHLPQRQKPILKDPFTVVDHEGKIMFELKDKKIITDITAKLLTQ